MNHMTLYFRFRTFCTIPSSTSLGPLQLLKVSDPVSEVVDNRRKYCIHWLLLGYISDTTNIDRDTLINNHINLNGVFELASHCPEVIRATSPTACLVILL